MWQIAPLPDGTSRAVTVQSGGGGRPGGWCRTGTQRKASRQIRQTRGGLPPNIFLGKLWSLGGALGGAGTWGTGPGALEERDFKERALEERALEKQALEWGWALRIPGVAPNPGALGLEPAGLTAEPRMAVGLSVNGWRAGRRAGSGSGPDTLQTPEDPFPPAQSSGVWEVHGAMVVAPIQQGV